MATGTTPGRFVWHEHRSPDPKAAQSFYVDLLGWGIEVWNPDADAYPMIKASGQMHGGFLRSEEGEPAHWLGVVSVDDVDAAAPRAVGMGGTLLAGPFDIQEVGRLAAVMDPQGAVLALMRFAGPDPENAGVFVWDELHTNDIEAARRYYGEVVGWTTRDVDMGGGFTYTMFVRASGEDAGGGAQLPDDPSPPHWLTYIATEDVDETTAKAASLGATTIVEPADIPGVGRFSVIQDPVGAFIGLFRPLPQQ